MSEMLFFFLQWTRNYNFTFQIKIQKCFIYSQQSNYKGAENVSWDIQHWKKLNKEKKYKNINAIQLPKTLIIY